MIHLSSLFKSSKTLLVALLLGSFCIFVSCGSKAEYHVGDIVLDNGTVLSQEAFASYEGSATPMAIIFSTTGGHYENSGRVLGVGLKVASGRDFATADTTGYTTNITANQTVVAAQEFKIENGAYNNEGFFGLIDGRKSWQNVARYDEKAKTSFENYPAYDFAVNYGKNRGFKKFEKGWYLPTAAEAFELAENIETVNAAAKLCEVPAYLGMVWTSSQNYGNNEFEYVVSFLDAGVSLSFKDMDFNVCSIYCFAE